MFQLFFIDFQLFYFLIRIIPVMRWTNIIDYFRTMVKTNVGWGRCLYTIIHHYIHWHCIRFPWGCHGRDHIVVGFILPMHLCRAFNIFQVYQYFTIYRWYFLLKFEQYLWISYTTLCKIRRYQRPYRWVKVPDTTPYWKACLCKQCLSLLTLWV